MSMGKAIIFWLLAILGLAGNSQSQNLTSAPRVPVSTEATDATDPDVQRQLVPSTRPCAAKSNYVNDTCKRTVDCNSPTMVCQNGLCVCREPLVQHSDPDNNHRHICKYGPTLGETCTEACVKPRTCTIGGTRRTCACLPPAKMDKGDCRLDCKEDELFLNGECKKRCAGDEIRVDNAGCLKRGGLDQKCVDNPQCSIPFAECVEGVCKCKLGFEIIDGKCETKRYSCPSGEPIILRLISTLA